MREFIQDSATPDALADEALRLLNNDAARERLSAELAGVVALLEGDHAAERAGRAVLDALSANATLKRNE